jgi:hypothetical protein
MATNLSKTLKIYSSIHHPMHNRPYQAIQHPSKRTIQQLHKTRMETLVLAVGSAASQV